MGSLHDKILDRVIRLFLRRDFQDDWVNFLSLGDLFSEVLLANFLGDEDDGNGGISEVAIEIGLDLGFGHFWV